MLAPVIHVLPLTTLQRERVLPTSGRVVVRKGQRVSATDIVAEANLYPQHIMLSVTRGLGLSPKTAEKSIQRIVGEKVSEGDVIAGPVGLARRVVRAPCAGHIVWIQNGNVLLELDGSLFRLRAALPGVVASVVAERGVVIENTGAVVQGVWGNGQIDAGLLMVGIHKPDDDFKAEQLDIGMRGSVILGGYCEESSAIVMAAELPVRGLILSSMSSSLIPIAEQMSFPIMILEGFGRLPMNMVAYRLLTTSERREVALNAETFDRVLGRRPEVFIPLPSAGSTNPPIEAVVFSLNQRVRVVSAPYHSKIGKLVALHTERQVFPNGMRASAADVQLESGEIVLLPLANLEYLE